MEQLWGKSQPRLVTCHMPSETIGGGTCVYVRIHATGKGSKSPRPADFEWFEYYLGKP